MTFYKSKDVEDALTLADKLAPVPLPGEQHVIFTRHASTVELQDELNCQVSSALGILAAEVRRLRLAGS